MARLKQTSAKKRLLCLTWRRTLYVCAAASAVKYLCNGDGDPLVIAQQTASAYAAAVASVVANCVLVGDVSAKVTALANARAKAEVWVNSYFDAYAFGSDCKTCEAFAHSWGFISKYVFLEAIASAEVKVCHEIVPTMFLSFFVVVKVSICEHMYFIISFHVCVQIVVGSLLKALPTPHDRGELAKLQLRCLHGFSA
jgi:hypothetical protein